MEKHNKKDMVLLAGIAYESLVNGPGIRRVLFAQICKHNCKNCFNPETHSENGGKWMDMDTIINSINENPILSGVTFSGGDPFEQADKFAYIAKQIKLKNNNKDFNIWCYTGYTYEYILENKEKKKGWNELLNNINVLVDGKFEESKKSDKLKYKGSSNQRIIDVVNSLKSNTIITLNF